MAHLVELRSAFPHLVCFPLSTKCSCSQLHSSSREMRMWAETSQHRILGGICMPGSVCEGTGCAKLAGHRGQTADGTVVRCCTRKCQIAAAFECCLTLCWFFPSLFPAVACFDSIGATQFSRTSEKRWVCPTCGVKFSTKRAMDGTV